MFQNMNTEFRYEFEKYAGPGSRYFCPQCQKKTFTRYIDLLTGQHLSELVGKCSRENKCNYLFTPKQYFALKKKRLRASFQSPLDFIFMNFSVSCVDHLLTIIGFPQKQHQLHIRGHKLIEEVTGKKNR